MADFLGRLGAGLWNFISTLAAVIYWLGLMVVAYFALMTGAVLITVAFVFVLSLLPESVAATILSIVDFLTWVARLGIRDGG